MSNWVQVAKAIQQTGVAERTLYRWIKQGKVSSQIVSGRTYTEIDEIKKIMARRRDVSHANLSMLDLKRLLRDLYANAVLFNRMSDPLWADLDRRVRRALGVS